MNNSRKIKRYVTDYTDSGNKKCGKGIRVRLQNKQRRLAQEVSKNHAFYTGSGTGLIKLEKKKLNRAHCLWTDNLNRLRYFFYIIFSERTKLLSIFKFLFWIILFSIGSINCRFLNTCAALPPKTHQLRIYITYH